MADSKGLAIAALVLGILGLFTAGGLVVGSLLGLGLALAALLRGTPSAGRDVVGAAVAANVFALLTVIPIGAALWAVRSSQIPLFERADDSLPEPAQAPTFVSPEVAAPAPPPPAPVRIGGAIPEPRKTRNVSPVYPRAAVESRIQGVVVLECTIGSEGKVVRVSPVSGHPLLTEAAVEAVRQWEYTPTLVDGVPVPVILTVKVNFKLS